MKESVDAAHVAKNDSYLSETVLRACDILKAFGVGDEALRLKDLVTRTGLNKSTALRLLRSLDEGGLIERVPKNQYKSKIQPIQRVRIRLGYAGMNTQSALSQEVTQSIIQNADLEQVELIPVDNRGSAKTALQNAEKLIEAGVDLVIEHQQCARIASTISSKFQAAGIPVIAVSQPHPGAIYYGPNHYKSGLMAGRALGQWVKRHFDGRVDELLLLEHPILGALSQTWLQGMEKGLYEALPNQQHARVLHLNGRGAFGPSFDTVRKHLRFSVSQRILVGAVNEESALGALSSFRFAGRLKHCAIVSNGASPIARAELRNASTRLIGSISNFPERFGRDLVRLARRILEKKTVLPATFVDDCLITASNVDLYYPLDSLSAPVNLPNHPAHLNDLQIA